MRSLLLLLLALGLADASTLRTREAASYSLNIRAGGGSIHGRSLKIADKLAHELKSQRIDHKVSFLWVPMGNSLAAARVALKHPGLANNQMTQVNVDEADYSETTGVGPLNGSDEYLQSGFAFGAGDQNNTHLMFVRSDSLVNDSIDMGAAQSGAGQIVIFDLADGKFYSDAYDHVTSAGRVVSGATFAGVRGCVIGSRTSATNHRLYRNGALLASNSTSGGTICTLQIYIAAFNVNNSVSGPGATAWRGASMGAGLDAAQAVDLTAAVERANDRLNRGIIP